MKVTSSITIKASNEAVFQALTERQDREALLPKTDLPARAELVASVPNSRIVVHERLGGLVGTTTITIGPSLDGSMVTIDFDFSIKGLLGPIRMLLFGPDLQRAYQAWSQALLVRLKARLEGGSVPPAPRVLSRRELRYLCITMALTAALAALVVEAFILSLAFPVVLAATLATYFLAYVLVVKYAAARLLRVIDAIRADLRTRA
jgi:hypothetical protein